MMSNKQRRLCIKALNQTIDRGSKIVAFIAITDGILHGIWSGIDAKQIHKLEHLYAKSIINSGIETMKTYETEPQEPQ